jgi:hypothetical protein
MLSDKDISQVACRMCAQGFHNKITAESEIEAAPGAQWERDDFL